MILTGESSLLFRLVLHLKKRKGARTKQKVIARYPLRIGTITLATTGKPVSAPPAPVVEPTEEPTVNVPETELAIMEGMVDMQSRIAALEAELTKLKGGK